MEVTRPGVMVRGAFFPRQISTIVARLLLPRSQPTMNDRNLTTICLFLVANLLPAGAAPPISSSQAGITWPEQQMLPVFAAPRALDIVDLQHAPGDLCLLMASLQGLVNRTLPRLYLLEGAEEGARTWLDSVGLPSQDHADPFELIRQYRDEIRGLIIYDPELADSVNLATTLAGQRDSLIASPELAQRLAAEPFNVPVLEDLRGRFKDKLEAYTWQFEHLWPTANQRLLVGLSPGRESRTRSGVAPGFEVLAADTSRERHGRNHQVYPIDLSSQLGGDAVFVRFEDAFRRDGWGASVHRVTVEADGRTVASFTPGTPAESEFLFDPQRSQLGDGFRFADGDRHFTYRFAVPKGTVRLTAAVEMRNQFRVTAGMGEPRMPWRPFGYLRDYAIANRAMVFWLDANAPAERALMEQILVAAGPGTPYLGWFANDIEGEFGAVEFCSNHGVYVVPSDWFNNLTVFSGIRAEPVAKRQRPARPEPKNRIYVTFVFSEGDNLQYNQHRMRVLWDDPARGKVPINWTSTPLLVDAAPAILGYYQRTASQNDLLVSGPSSVGYFYPEPWPDAQLASMLGRTRPYLDRSGMQIPYVLNRMDHRDVPLEAESVAAYRDQHGVPGIFLGWGEAFGVEIIGGVPISSVRGIGTVKEGIDVLADARKSRVGESPLFLSVGLFAWRLTPSDVVEIVKSLDAEFAVVLADEYFSLIQATLPAGG